jgi:2-aminoadipate transaminase
LKNWNERFARNMRPYQGYSIGKLLALIDDPDVISLAGGMPAPEVFLHQQLKAATTQRFDRDINRIMQYSSIRGEQELIEAVAAYLQRDGIRVGPANVMITSSGQQGLDLAGRLFLDEGDAVVVERPTFAGALAAFEMQRPEYLGIQLADDGLDVDQLGQILSDRRAAGHMPKFIYVVPDFQNPTGICLSLPKRHALLELARHHQIPIVEDSPYRTLRYRGAQIPSLFALDQEHGGGHVIGVYTFSKLFCPGMRVGFTIGPAEVITKMTNIKEGSTLNTPKYNQDMCAAFLTAVDLDAYFERCCRYYRNKLGILLDALAAHFTLARDFTWTVPDGGLFVWLSAPHGVDTRKLFRAALTHKVAFVPGEAFYGQNPEHRHMRLNFSYPTEAQLEAAVSRLSACLAQYDQRG